MAKQRRARPGPSARRLPKTPARRSKPSGTLVESQKASGQAKQPRPQEPARAPANPEAVRRYEQSLAMLQRHEYGAAASVLQSVLTDYPEEKELHERVRLYLAVCRRQQTSRESTPRTDEERLYAATLALNRADYEAAVSHLESIRSGDSENDQALYLLAVAYSLSGHIEQAAGFLVRAIELNPENRSYARQDADLEAVRREEGIRAMLDAPSAPQRSDRRRPFRRPGR